MFSVDLGYGFLERIPKIKRNNNNSEVLQKMFIKCDNFIKYSVQKIYIFILFDKRTIYQFFILFLL
jgi:hypothetical protein